jgi:uncharacterized membrane protein YfcA
MFNAVVAIGLLLVGLLLGVVLGTMLGSWVALRLRGHAHRDLAAVACLVGSPALAARALARWIRRDPAPPTPA